MKIIYIATYPPRQCGIGTYTRNKFMAMTRDEQQGEIVAIDDAATAHTYPPEVGFVIRQDKLTDYHQAARYINSGGADICILEHEFGIFGGQHGVYILSLLEKLEIPFIAVFHTVLKEPTEEQLMIIKRIAGMAAQTVVMAQKAVELLTNVYDIPGQRIRVIEHGVPEQIFQPETCKKEFQLEDRRVLLTFGLIGRNKGIETVLQALPAVVKRHPELLYIILGKTHPSVVRHSGEEYRESLKDMAHALNLENHVLFVDEFVDEERLGKYLYATDIYITPYLNEAQITSGTLSYAVGAGCAVVSTPYWHAAELLADGRGCLFDFRDSPSLTSILIALLENKSRMDSIREKARNYGRQVTWPVIGKKYFEIAGQILEKMKKRKLTGDVQPILPVFALDHIRRLTDSTGIIQHAKFSVPNRKEGYCLDDNARALLMTTMAYRQEQDPELLELMRIYLGYIHHMQTNAGHFRNFMSFGRQFLDDQASEDAFGRTVWALGYLSAYPPDLHFYHLAKELFQEALPHFEKQAYSRSIANTLIGASFYAKRHPEDKTILHPIRKMTHTLADLYHKCCAHSWKWFEECMTYDNALLPLSLLHASAVLKDDSIKELALEAVQFLAATTLAEGHLVVIGNSDWYRKGASPSRFAQQPVDAMAMVLLFQEAFELTADERYLGYLFRSLEWFFGKNDLGLSLYDPETKGCCDGLEESGLNRNQGAESTLAYWIAHLAAEEVLARSKPGLSNVIPMNRSRMRSLQQELPGRFNQH